MYVDPTTGERINREWWAAVSPSACHVRRTLDGARRAVYSRAVIAGYRIEHYDPETREWTPTGEAW